MSTDNLEKYRNEIYKYIQEEIVPKYSEIKSCRMEVYPEHLAWDVGFIFKHNIDGLKNFKSMGVLEKEIRYLLRGYCSYIGVESYYFFILPIFIVG